MTAKVCHSFAKNTARLTGRAVEGFHWIVQRGVPPARIQYLGTISVHQPPPIGPDAEFVC